MSTPFISNSILTRKVNTANANRLQSHREQDPDEMMCPVWNHQDLAGRPAGEYSFYSKRAGCNSALDRVNVENLLRPRYTNYVLRNAAGIGGYDNGYEIEGYEPTSGNIAKIGNLNSYNERSFAQSNTGKFGLVSVEQRKPGNSMEEAAAVGYNLSQDQLARHQQVNRNTASGYHGFTSSERLKAQNYPQKMVTPVRYSVNPNLMYETPSRRDNGYVNYRQISGCSM
jgi:hypothetical protein